MMIKPMLFTEGDLGSIDDVLTGEWALEQKLDGVRLMVRVTQGHIEFLGAHGEQLRFAAAAQHFRSIGQWLAPLCPDEGDELVFDGELMIGSGEYHVFDIAQAALHGTTYIGPDTPFRLRRAGLEGIAAHLGRVKVVRQARTLAEKQALVAAVTEAGGEGFMAKRLDGRYASGQRVTWGLKLKFVRTADVVVTSFKRTRTTGSAELAVYDGGVLRRVGACSLIGKPEVAAGDVIEVRYAGFRDAMLMPRWMGARPDKPASACTIDQFKSYDKELIVP